MSTEGCALTITYTGHGSDSPKVDIPPQIRNVVVSKNREMFSNDDHIQLVALQKSHETLNISVSFARVERIPSKWFDILSIVVLSVYGAGLKFVPIDIVKLRNLKSLCLDTNQIDSISGAVGRLPALQELNLAHNYLTWIPSTLAGYLGHCNLFCNRFHYNAEMAIYVTSWNSPAAQDVIERTVDQLRVFAYEFTDAAIGLQDLELPALVTLEILDALCPNTVPMHKKWELIVVVKHFRH